MSIQYVSILPIFKTFSQTLQKQFILHCPKSFIQFLSKCLVNLLRGELQDFQKRDVVKYQRGMSELTGRRTSLHKRRTILSSPKGLQLISVITPFVNKLMDQFVLIPYSIYQSQSTLPKKTKIGTKTIKRGDCTKLF